MCVGMCAGMQGKQRVCVLECTLLMKMNNCELSEICGHTYWEQKFKCYIYENILLFVLSKNYWIFSNARIYPVFGKWKMEKTFILMEGTGGEGNREEKDNTLKK